MTERACPECGKPMTVVRVLRPQEDRPRFATFYCKPCEFVDTIPLNAATETERFAVRR
jgi:predicted RNA-binding Zn-ribbon protein involved in translation (DUF1610 family)